MNGTELEFEGFRNAKRYRESVIYKTKKHKWEEFRQDMSNWRLGTGVPNRRAQTRPNGISVQALQDVALLIQNCFWLCIATALWKEFFYNT